MQDFDQVLKDLEEDVTELERELGLTPGLISSLAEEDDWSFVIKAHALIEAALASWLSVHFDEPALVEPLSYLEIGHPKYGKVALTKALEISSSFDRKFISELTVLRNKIAHRIENVSFSFQGYIGKLDANQKRNFVNAFGYFYLREGKGGKAIVPDQSIVIEEPKKAILNGLKLFLAMVNARMQTAHLQRKTTEYKLEILKLIEARNQLTSE